MDARASADGRAPQRMLALAQANRVRVARANLKRRVGTGELHAAEIVLSCPWMVTTMPLTELLVCQPRWGSARCRTFLKTVGVDESKLLGSLTERQRVMLAALLATKPANA